MKKTEQSDNRKHTRLRSYHLVRFRFLTGDGGKQYSASIVAGTRDIGAGGICLETKEALPQASVIELMINFSHSGTPVTALAKVSWVKKLKSVDMYRYGLEFVEMDDNLRRMIQDHVERISKALGPEKGGEK
jgi:c-di-GMP-binding flagellar brake protein YcgR